MPRRSWIYTPDGRTIEKGTPEHEAYLGEQQAGPMVFGDEPDFRSPVDGRLYSGKLGMREHNARHNTVNHRDLVGLPYEVPKQAPDRKAIRQAIITAAQRKGYMEGQ